LRKKEKKEKTSPSPSIGGDVRVELGKLAEVLQFFFCSPSFPDKGEIKKTKKTFAPSLGNEEEQGTFPSLQLPLVPSLRGTKQSI
jgi:hypothetical protein